LAKPVIESDGGAVEHGPKPEERLGLGESFAIDVGVMLGLEGDVEGVERELKDIER
jgi:hypothetical protein